jgi:hypothetical protein
MALVVLVVALSLASALAADVSDAPVIYSSRGLIIIEGLFSRQQI